MGPCWKRLCASSTFHCCGAVMFILSVRLLWLNTDLFDFNQMYLLYWFIYWYWYFIVNIFSSIDNLYSSPSPLPSPRAVLAGQRVPVRKGFTLPGGLEWGNEGLKVLGVFLGTGNFQRKTWVGSREKVCVRLSKWKWLLPQLSYKGRALVFPITWLPRPFGNGLTSWHHQGTWLSPGWTYPFL